MGLQGAAQEHSVLLRRWFEPIILQFQVYWQQQSPSWAAACGGCTLAAAKLSLPAVCVHAPKLSLQEATAAYSANWEDGKHTVIIVLTQRELIYYACTTSLPGASLQTQWP